MLDELREMDVLPTFSGTVKGVTNAIEDPMSSATDLVKSTGASMAGEVLRAADTVYFGTRNFRNTASKNREYTVAMSLGNMFAKRINMGDNFSSFDEFINEYRDFAYWLFSKNRSDKSFFLILLPQNFEMLIYAENIIIFKDFFE